MRTKEKLLIIGASGHGRVVADIAVKSGVYTSIAFLDDNESFKSAMGLPVIGKCSDAIKFIDDFDIIVGIGDNTTREKIHTQLEYLGATIPVLIHPRAVIGTQVDIGKGTVVMAGAVVNCGSTIGKGCIINTGSTVDHDCILEDFVHISPGAHLAGGVKVGRRTWLGIGSAICNNIYITEGCIIGAGAVVIGDIVEVGTYVGVPVRRVI